MRSSMEIAGSTMDSGSDGMTGMDDVRRALMVTVLIDRLPSEWESQDVFQLLHPFGPSHVCIAADECGKLLGFAFAFFSEKRSADKALMALGLMDLSGRQLCVTRAVAPRLPGEVTG